MIIKHIKAENSKNFNDFKLSWYEANIIYFIGQNGCGKSTFCKLLIDLLCNQNSKTEKMFSSRNSSFFEEEHVSNFNNDPNIIMLDGNSSVDIKFEISQEFSQKIAKKYEIQQNENLIKSWSSIKAVKDSVSSLEDNKNNQIIFDSYHIQYNFINNLMFYADFINPDIFSYETSFRYDEYPELVYSLGVEMLVRNSFYKFCALKTFKDLDDALKDLKLTPKEHFEKIEINMNLFFNSFTSLKYYYFKVELKPLKAKHKVFYMSLDIYSVYNKKKILKYSEYSTGLKTFLSVLLSSYSTSNKGLIILDQPEVGLQSVAWEELKKLLNDISKEIKKKFIVITHSDFIISEIDFNDLYIVQSINNKLSVNNISNIISKTPLDYLELIYSLGYEKYYYEKISCKILIVCEGKTDVVYLNKLNDLYKWNFDIHFLNARSGSETVQFADNLINLTNNTKKVGILIDNDIKTPNKNLLTNLRKNYRFINDFRLPNGIEEIEDMFSKTDLTKYQINKKEKVLSAKRFFNLVDNDEPDAVTLNNFKKLFDEISSKLSCT